VPIFLVLILRNLLTYLTDAAKLKFALQIFVWSLHAKSLRTSVCSLVREIHGQTNFLSILVHQFRNFYLFRNTKQIIRRVLCNIKQENIRRRK
jgi:hypothetical protein